eukprot:TRINITY_DN3611_c0_g1_i3.p1 TRINITY_DN3611_c0_g1~~TRINITY_DN3611_c0_g1_i3.p1  ORF type:complete len:263 (+),score=39.53 TRINITY_DN3611_c0_g1_i3:540-1328(+)
MEFPFLLPRVLRSAAVVALDANPMRHHMTPELQQVVDAMGLASMKAQGLSCVLTTCSKIMTTHQRLYIASEEKKVLGILKVGTKQLFVWRETGRICEITPLCVLDFFVHESRQRCGIGKLLFESMLERENLAPQMLGFDQPSHKFLSFLRRHYGLFDYVAQKNNFVVFNAYFEGATVRCRAENPQASPFDRPLTARQRPHRGERVRFEPESEPRVRSPPQEPPKRTPYTTSSPRTPRGIHILQSLASDGPESNLFSVHKNSL